MRGRRRETAREKNPQLFTAGTSSVTGDRQGEGSAMLLFMGKQGNAKENPFQKVILSTGENRTWAQRCCQPRQLVFQASSCLAASPSCKLLPFVCEGSLQNRGKTGFQLPARQHAVKLTKIMLSLTAVHRGSTCPSWRT